MVDVRLVKQVIFAAVVTTAIVAFASQRRVNIIGGTAGSTSGTRMVELQNGSTVPVNYTITCYSNGSVVPSMNNISQSLTPRMSKSYGEILCGNGSSATTANFNSSSGAHACGWVDYSQRNTVCANGYTVCSIGQAAAAATSYSTGWVEFPAPYNNSSSNSFQISDVTGTYTGMQNWQGSVAMFEYGSRKCRPSGGGADVLNCTAASTTMYMPAICCPQAGTVFGKLDSCEVVINASETGYLQSPQFKGGAPF